MSKKGAVVRKLTSNPRTCRAVIKRLAKPTGRFGRRKIGRTRRTYYGGAVVLGIGALVIVRLISLLLWLLRRAPRESGMVPQVRDLMTSEVVAGM